MEAVISFHKNFHLTLKKTLGGNATSKFSEHGREDILRGSKTLDHLAAGKQLHRNQLSEGRHLKISWLCWTPSHDQTAQEQIQWAQHGKSDLYIIWLDHANAYGCIPHQHITTLSHSSTYQPASRTWYQITLAVSSSATKLWDHYSPSRQLSWWNGFTSLTHPAHSGLRSF